MPFLYEGVQLRQAEASLSSGISSHGFRVAVLNHSEDLGSLRWTVDTEDDLEFVRRVLEHLGDLPTYTWLDVVELLKAHPELAEINAKREAQDPMGCGCTRIGGQEHMTLMTLFSAPKPFTDPRVAMIQMNAISSWCSAGGRGGASPGGGDGADRSGIAPGRPSA